MSGALYDFLVSVGAQITGTAVVAIGALALWRFGVQFVGDYRRLRVDACTLLTTHAPFIANLSREPTEEGRAARKLASTELRLVADRLTNTDCPPGWLAWLLGLPSSSEVWEAGRTMRAISNGLFPPHNADDATVIEQQKLSREDRDKACRLLRCRSQRPSN